MNATPLPALDCAKAHPGPVYKHDRQLTRCRFSPCGRYLFAAGLDGKLHRWELESGQKKELVAHPTWIQALEVDPRPDASRLYTADCHGTVSAWSSAGGELKPEWSLKEAHAGFARTLAVSPDGAHLASAGSDLTVRLWTAAGKPVRTFEGHRGYIFSSLFHPDRKHLVTGDLFGVVKQWELSTGRQVRDLDAGLLHTRKEDFLADVGGVRGLAFDREGRRLICTGFTNAESNTFCPGTPAALVFDWASGNSEPRLQVKEKPDGPINAARFLVDGTIVATGEGQSSAAVWFWKPGQSETYHSIPGASAYDLDLHPDGRRVALALFDTRGHSGNGKRLDAAGYIPHGSLLRVLNLFAKS